MAKNRNNRRVPTHLQLIGDKVAQYVKRDNPEVKIDGLKKTSFEDYTDEYDRMQLLDFYRMRLTPAQFEHLKTKGFVKIDAPAYYFDLGMAYANRYKNENAEPIWPAYLFTIDYEKHGAFKGHSLLGARTSISAGGYSAEEAYSQKVDPKHEETRRLRAEAAGKTYQPKQYEEPPFETSVISDEVKFAVEAIIYGKQLGKTMLYNRKTQQLSLVEESSTGN